MSFIGRRVKHRKFGEGTIVFQEEEHGHRYITVEHSEGPKRFVYPDAFERFLTTEDEELRSEVETLLEKKRAENDIEKEKKRNLQEGENMGGKREASDLSNIAFKCAYCDGGTTLGGVGFDCVCSDKNIEYIVRTRKHAWCSNAASPCSRYLDGRLTRASLDEMMEDGGYVCYESRMLRDWRVSVGERDGKPAHLPGVRIGSLAILTARVPGAGEEERSIFGAFLIGGIHEGNRSGAGFVSAKPDTQIVLAPDEASRLPFWRYYKNQSTPEQPLCGNGLHRYISDTQAAQILRDIVEVKTDAKEKEKATRVFNDFCRKAGIVDVPEVSGALTLNRS